MGLDAPWHWVLLAIVVIALFGYKKLPDAARSLGRSLRIFKTEIKGMSEDDKAREDKARDATPTTPTLQATDTAVEPSVRETPPPPTPPVAPLQKSVTTPVTNGGRPGDSVE